MNNDSLTTIRVECVDSTNTALKNMAKEYPGRDVLMIADTQTGGRGRMGRSFSSPSGGIYMSLLLHPDFEPEDSLLLTTAVAVAVSEAVERVCGKVTAIKWVNDIFLHGRKMCGILTEAKIDARSSKLEYAVVGVGINVESPEKGFEDAIKDVAGAIYDFGKAPEGIRDILIKEIISGFYRYYDKLSERVFFAEYKKRSCVIGKEVRVIDNIFEPDKSATVKVLDINEKCHLIVEYQNGTVKELSSGDVSISFNTSRP